MRIVLLALFVCFVARAESPFAPDCNHRNLSFVAHQDDDLLFMNPDLMRAIRGGECVSTVYLTAGDANLDQVYWGGRETGIREAYALMSGAEARWKSRTLMAAGKRLNLFELEANPRVHVIFIRLPDGGNGNGFARYHFQSLKKLWSGALDKMTTVDARETFTRDELLKALSDLIASSTGAELRVRTLDRVNHGFDHSDHYHSALFATAAYDRVFPGKFPVAYRGYNISGLPQNLTATETEQKNRVFVTYARHDSILCPDATKCEAKGLYIPWLSRQYHE